VPVGQLRLRSSRFFAAILRPLRGEEPVEPYDEEPVEPHEQPRPLTEREREILDFLLGADLPGIEELREQAGTALAVRWGPRDPSVDLYVDREATRPSPVRTRPVIQTYTMRKGAKDLRELLLWVDEDGWLSSVELAHLYEEWPEDLPPPSEFEPPRPYRSAPREP
jgi:hypothetical protein